MPRSTSTTAGAGESGPPTASRPSRTTHPSTCSRGPVGEVAGLDAELAATLTDTVLTEVVADVPDGWLAPVPGAATPAELRASYVSFLRARRDGVGGRRPWLPGAAS